MLRESPYLCAYAFDPGDSTGMAYASYAYGDELSVRTMTQEELITYLDDVASRDTVVFYETFVSRPALFSRRQVAPENIGVIKLWAHISGAVLLRVSPSETHRIKREDLKAAGWKWSTEHEFDAIRIMVYGLTMLRYR